MLKRWYNYPLNIQKNKSLDKIWYIDNKNSINNNQPDKCSIDADWNRLDILIRQWTNSIYEHLSPIYI